MMSHLNARNSGIAIVGPTEWGTHICQFYETREDLLQVLIPYFKAGLDNNEYCLWITCDPITAEDAIAALKESIPDIQRRLDKKDLEIIPYTDWYTPSGRFDREAVTSAWMEKLREALDNGYDGMRVNGNEAWLKSDDWNDFMRYERDLTAMLQHLRMIVLCTYPLSGTTAGAVLDIAHAHECVIARRKGRWEMLEGPERLQVVREEERKSIAREMHDELGQLLTVLKLDISRLKKSLDKPDEATGKKLQSLMDITDSIVRSVRRLASDLRPGLLDVSGLGAAIEWHLQEFEALSGIATHFTGSGSEENLPEHVKIHLFRIVQESLTNVARHSKATDVRVDMQYSEKQLILTITDNGHGFDKGVIAGKRTLGILGMKERTTIIGGEYHLRTKPGQGTGISVKIPLRTQAEKPPPVGLY
ncbi:MEDS domain-containing protein [Puia dinghuensis]|uniref:histidine kinase n=1 Tax=Puia dinghuensis TaxID=1792502 RepID=A0A8J2UDS2_9BACT|nr:MEDS domain-containing protein [Puia dinghuensis]GGB02448.1 hypothetical protein GCM10011511_27150 [Puia dinghuensis]